MSDADYTPVRAGAELLLAIDLTRGLVLAPHRGTEVLCDLSRYPTSVDRFQEVRSAISGALLFKFNAKRRLIELRRHHRLYRIRLDTLAVEALGLDPADPRARGVSNGRCP